MSVDDVPAEVSDNSGATLSNKTAIGANTATAAKEVNADETVSTEYYTLSGTQSNRPGKGLSIKVERGAKRANSKASLVIRK